AEDDVAGDLHGDDLALVVLAADDDEIADAALGELALDARHPRALAGTAVGADGVQQDARVAHILAAVGALAPLVLDRKMIIAILLVRGDVAVAVARDVQHLVGDAEDLAGILTLGVAEPGGEAGQVLAVEENDLGLRSDRLCQGSGPRGEDRREDKEME